MICEAASLDCSTQALWLLEHVPRLPGSQGTLGVSGSIHLGQYPSAPNRRQTPHLGHLWRGLVESLCHSRISLDTSRNTSNICPEPPLLAIMFRWELSANFWTIPKSLSCASVFENQHMLKLIPKILGMFEFQASDGPRPWPCRMAVVPALQPKF